MYRIETHMHTIISSKCGWLNAVEACESYADKRYSGIVVTDHFSRATVGYIGIDLSDKTNAMHDFFKGAYQMQEIGADYGLKIYLGTELRFDGSDNDYLIFGFTPSLFHDPDAIMRNGLESFRKRCQAEGALIIQAHPFRKGCTPSDPNLLDGVEVFNLNLRHESHNSQALDFAKEHNLLMTAGSDCHRPYNVGQAGIIVETLPSDEFSLREMIRTESYQLFTCPERVEKRD